MRGTRAYVSRVPRFRPDTCTWRQRQHVDGHFGNNKQQRCRSTCVACGSSLVLELSHDGAVQRIALSAGFASRDEVRHFLASFVLRGSLSERSRLLVIVSARATGCGLSYMSHKPERMRSGAAYRDLALLLWFGQLQMFRNLSRHPLLEQQRYRELQVASCNDRDFGP